MFRLRLLHHSDRLTIMALLMVAAVGVVLLYVCGDKQSATEPASFTKDGAAATLHGSGLKTGDNRQPATIVYDEGQTVVTLKPFDPNTADSTTLLALGLPPYQVRAIYRYRAKGGTYRRREDFARLPGLTAKKYRELEPYIQISADYLPATSLFADSRSKETASAEQSSEQGGGAAATEKPLKRRYPEKLAEGETIDLNTADTTLLQKVPGIGPYFARKIVTYRARLGGFYDVSQLLAIEGMPDDALSFLAIRNAKLTKLDINRLTPDELRRHPYISYSQAKAIEQYRRQKGPITSLSQLSLINAFTAEDLQRLQPYIAY